MLKLATLLVGTAQGSIASGRRALQADPNMSRAAEPATCTPGPLDDPSWNGGFGACCTYATHNSGFCSGDGGCGPCQSSCAEECFGSMGPVSEPWNPDMWGPSAEPTPCEVDEENFCQEVVWGWYTCEDYTGNDGIHETYGDVCPCTCGPGPSAEPWDPEMGEAPTLEWSGGIIASGHLEIPPQYTSIAEGLSGDLTLVSISGPSIRTIAALAYQGCQNLVSIDFPMVEEIGGGAFEYTGLRFVQLPESARLMPLAFDQRPTVCGGAPGLSYALYNTETNEYETRNPGPCDCTVEEIRQACSMTAWCDQCGSITSMNDCCGTAGDACGVNEMLTHDQTCVVCPFPERCVGGQCVEGATGDGCATCDLEPSDGGPKYFQFGMSCLRCPVDTQYVFYAGVAVFFLLGLWLLWRVTNNDGLDDSIATAVDLQSLLSRSTVALSIMVPHLQIFSTIISIDDIDWPDFIKKLGKLLKELFYFDYGTMTTPECSTDSTSPFEIYRYKFWVTHVAFFGLVGGFALAAIVEKLCLDKASPARHAVNAAIALWTVCVVALVRSCLGAALCSDQTIDGEIDPSTITCTCQRMAFQGYNGTEHECIGEGGGCTYYPGHSTTVAVMGRYLDAMPEVSCDDPSFVSTQEVPTLILLTLYCAIIPVALFIRLLSLRLRNSLYTAESVQALGWLIVKYHSGAWFFEFVFIAYKIIIAAISVLERKQESALYSLVQMAICTAIVLALVVLIKPYNDDTCGSSTMTNANIVQVSVLICTLIEVFIGMICYSIGARSYNVDAAVSFFTLFVAAFPLVLSLYLDLKRPSPESKKENCEMDVAMDERNESEVENPVSTEQG